MTKQLTPLEALEKIKDNMAYQIQLRGDCVVVPYFDIIKTELEKTVVLSNQLEHERKIRIKQEKKLKALEIIKEKEVQINRLNRSHSAKQYNLYLPKEMHLTQPEFDLLKEVLK